MFAMPTKYKSDLIKMGDVLLTRFTKYIKFTKRNLEENKQNKKGQQQYERCNCTFAPVGDRTFLI